MTEGEKAGWWALVYLSIVLFGVWFTVAAFAWFYIKGWFL